MAKNIFQSVEIVDLTKQKVKVEAPVFGSKEETVSQEHKDELLLQNLREEVVAFKISWAEEKKEMIQRALDEADSIKKEAERIAFEEVKNKTDAAIREKKVAETEAEKIIHQAEIEAERIRSEAESDKNKKFSEALETGRKEGRESGWEEGKAEADRLVQHLHKIINESIEKRKGIIDEAESRIVDLVLLISRKVIKVISENQKNVVIQNVAQALKKLKNRGEVVIRVNLRDLEITTRHTKDFVDMLENIESIKVLEDSSVEPGGAVIETDFGQIDARIHNQLMQIESAIQDLVPIQSDGSV